MATLLQSAAYANDPDLVPPLMAAMARAAVDVAAEADSTDGHDNRFGLAVQVLNNTAGLVPAFAWATSTNATVVDNHAVHGIGAEVLTDLQFVVNSVWNAIAGADVPS